MMIGFPSAGKTTHVKKHVAENPDKQLVADFVFSCLLMSFDYGGFKFCICILPIRAAVDLLHLKLFWAPPILDIKVSRFMFYV